MAKRGPKPTPTALKRLRGNPGKRKLASKDEEVQLPDPPDTFAADTPIELADDDVAIAEWRRVVPMLTAAKLVSIAERGILISLCIQWSRYVEASKDLRERGLIIDVPQKQEDGQDLDGVDIIIRYAYPIQNPNLSIANKALQFCLKIWSELGLTPSSRTRVTPIGAPKSDGDGFDEFD